MNRSEIMEHLGPEATWKMVRKEFRGRSLEQVEAKLNKWWPKEDNSVLAESIFREVNR